MKDCKEIEPVNPKGIQSWIFIGRTDAEAETPILWPPDATNWLIGKDPDAGKDWRQEEKGMTEDETVGWHQFNEHDLSKIRELVMDRGAWRAAVHGITKSRTQVSDWTELIRVNPKLPIYPSSLSRCKRVWTSSRSWWWTGKPGLLQSMGSQRVRHSWVTELLMFVANVTWEFVYFHCELVVMLHSRVNADYYKLFRWLLIKDPWAADDLGGGWVSSQQKFCWWSPWKLWMQKQGVSVLFCQPPLKGLAFDIGILERRKWEQGLKTM